MLGLNGLRKLPTTEKTAAIPGLSEQHMTAYEILQSPGKTHVVSCSDLSGIQSRWTMGSDESIYLVQILLAQQDKKI